MIKKKCLIYSLIFLTFCILIVLYGINVVKANERENVARIETAVAVSENSIRKSMEYHGKTILLDCANLNLERTTTPQEAAALLKQGGKTEGGYYIVDANGRLVMEGAPLNGKRLDNTALQLARTGGYSAAVLVDADGYIALFTPIAAAWNGYVAHVYAGDEFVSLVTENITLSNADICLFDEWSNILGTSNGDKTEGKAERVLAIVQGAEAFSYSPADNALQDTAITGTYHVYFTTSVPHNWFFGTRVSRLSASEGYFFNIPLSSLFMFAVLIFLLITMISLDAMSEKETRKKISHVSNLDALTGLLNAMGMREDMLTIIQHNHGKKLALVCVDIVAFSRINTMFGHSMGDCLLQTVASVVRDQYICGARTNADYFVFLTHAENCDAVAMEAYFARAIETQLGAQYLQMISFKFGINMIDTYPVNFQSIYEGALLALKSAKKAVGKNDIVFNMELKKNADALRNLAGPMMHALSKEEFLVYVQPQIDLPSESCCRGEALIRWNSEFMGFLPPDKFVPVFEDNGFIVETDFYMLTAAMQVVQNRARAGLSPVILAVNQSKVTISFPNYFQRLKYLIEEYPDAPLAHIELEITESALEDDLGTIVPLIHSIKKLGFSIAMDDFGSGYSSLNTLRILPIDVLKIDRGFLEECENSVRCRTIITNVIRMAKELNIKVVCEGVENETQLAFLKQHNCDIVQGYFYSRPIPLKDFLSVYFPEDRAAEDTV